MEDQRDADKPNEEQKRIAKEIEAVFERFYKERSAYSKGHFHKNEFFLRNDYALVILKNERDIFMSFSERTPPSYAALFTLLLDGIHGTNLFICEDYITDDTGSMLCDEEDGSSTAAMIWDQKEAYYGMLREKVKKVLIRKLREEEGPRDNPD
ncbi:MAG: hypothetical protein KKE57_03045 [Proteobacteria bacterium]|nr:hypothetical protein [Pseudomonadota bacterium]